MPDKRRASPALLQITGCLPGRYRNFVAHSFSYGLLGMALFLLPSSSSKAQNALPRPLLTLGAGIKALAQDVTQGVIWARVRPVRYASARPEVYAGGGYTQSTLSLTLDLPILRERITFFAGPGITYNNDGHGRTHAQATGGGMLRVGRVYLQGTLTEVFRHGDYDTGVWAGVGYGF